MTPKLCSPTAWLAMLALGAGSLAGQENLLPVSRTAGVLTVQLPRNKSTLLGLPYVTIAATGTVTAVNGAQLTLASSPALLPDAVAVAHALKITSRVDQRGSGPNAPAGSSTNAYGLAAKVTAQAGQTVTAALAAPPNAGDEFVLYRIPTLASVFGAANSAGLTGAATPDAADILYLGSGGELVGYFYHSTANAWRRVATPETGSEGGTEIAPGTALLVVRKDAGSASIALTLSGDLLPGRQVASVAGGYQVINNPFTVSTTLAASGLQQQLTGGTGAGAADILYLEHNGVLTGYYYKTGGVGGSGWRSLGDNLTDQGAVLVAPGKALLFKEQAGAAGFALQEPFAE